MNVQAAGQVESSGFPDRDLNRNLNRKISEISESEWSVSHTRCEVSLGCEERQNYASPRYQTCRRGDLCCWAGRTLPVHPVSPHGGCTPMQIERHKYAGKSTTDIDSEMYARICRSRNRREADHLTIEQLICDLSQTVRTFSSLPRISA